MRTIKKKVLDKNKSRSKQSKRLGIVKSKQSNKKRLVKKCKGTKRPFRWLLIYYTIYSHEYADFVKRVLPYIESTKKKCRNVAFDLISISRTYGGSRSIDPSTTNGYSVISYSPGQKQFKVAMDPCEDITACIQKMLNAQFNRSKGRGYDGIMYSGHSNGIAMGYDRDQVLENIDLASILRKEVKRTHRKLEVVAFDSCYQGTLATIFDFRKVTKYIMASPSYHDHRSVIEADTFFQKPAGMSVIDWLKSITDSYVQKADRLHHIDYPIMNNIFSGPAIGRLGNYITKSRLYDTLKFTKGTQIFHDDPNLHDLERALDKSERRKDVPTAVKAKIRRAKILFRKSVVHAPHNPKNKLATVFPKLAVHSYLPDYVDSEVVCRMKYFGKTKACKVKKSKKSKE
uniref:Clostripain-related C11 protease n=1 Tax=Clandestinovirus TaxID=2831644 RepID=A0A8F8KKL0_9VIRU|nr:clostripain-related C11 protease [Clandestinovirus]